MFYKTPTGEIYIGTKNADEDILLTQEEQNQFMQNKQSNQEAKEFLDSTDWMVIRHRDQVEIEAATSLSTEEFSELLYKRQQARDSISED